MSAAGDGALPPMSAAGFTLIELLVVIAILSLVTGIVFPAMDKAMQRQAFAASCARTEAGLHAARAAAIRTGAAVRIGPAADRHGFSYGDVANPVSDTAIVSLPDRGLAFFGDGSATGGEIALRDHRLARRWSIRSSTGMIERLP